MALVKFYKVAALPGSLEPDSFYYVENGGYAESYLTNSSGQARAVGNSAMINALIGAAITDALSDLNALEVVPDIAARDALVLERNALALVIDATADPTVDAGSALYAYVEADTSWVKVAEYESMDVVIQWASIQGRPNSSPAQIDTAVSQSHTHSNKAVLDKFTESGGQVLYGGNPIQANWETANW